MRSETRTCANTLNTSTSGSCESSTTSTISCSICGTKENRLPATTLVPRPAPAEQLEHCNKRLLRRELDNVHHFLQDLYLKEKRQQLHDSLWHAPLRHKLDDHDDFIMIEDHPPPTTKPLYTLSYLVWTASTNKKDGAHLTRCITSYQRSRLKVIPGCAHSNPSATGP